MRYVTLLSFMLKLLSRHRRSLLMSGIARCGGVGGCSSAHVCICIYAQSSALRLFVRAYARVCSSHMFVCLSRRGFLFAGLRSVAPRRPTTIKGQGLRFTKKKHRVRQKKGPTYLNQIVANNQELLCTTPVLMTYRVGLLYTKCCCPAFFSWIIHASCIF